ncbi:MAG: DUF370 domain-containing protein [Ruminococcus sp.]|nr:DUF370 domain-containing protein [Ruminococcus sp.]
MYLHIGNDYMIRTKDLVGIFDIENTSVSKITRDYLANSGRRAKVVYCTYELPKSFVVCLDEELTETVYISRISTATLLKRIRKQVSDKKIRK